MQWGTRRVRGKPHIKCGKPQYIAGKTAVSRPFPARSVHLMNRVVTTNNTDLDGAAAWSVDPTDRLGGPGTGLAIAAENLFPPLPSGVIRPLADFAAARGGIPLVGAIARSLVSVLATVWLVRRLRARLALTA